jgi:hypothetical protein
MLSKFGNVSVKISVHLFERMRPRASTRCQAVIEDASKVVVVLRAIFGQWSPEGRLSYPEKIAIKYGIHAEISRIGDELWLPKSHR